jgi:hypothetical protein
VVNSTGNVFGVRNSRNAICWRGLKKEKKDSMDAVIIGASNVIAFWQPAFGWADHGIAVWSISMPGLRADAIKYLMIEARKTQPNAVYIVNLSNFKGNGIPGDPSHIHNPLNYMPFSLSKVKMTHAMLERTEFRGLDALEYYLPIIRFHSRWDDLKSWAFGASTTDYKLSYKNVSYLEKVFDITTKFTADNDIRKSVPKDVKDVFVELLDYCDENHVKALFVKSPQATDYRRQGRMNTLEDMVAQRGYPCLDLLEDFYSVGFDPRTDFYNSGHTNVHGSLKFSKILGDYLVENYHFEDKRGLPGWESWDKACQSYNAICSLYTLPIEREHAPRFESDIPALAKPSVNEMSITVSWTGVEGAEGYAIFRKSNQSSEGKTWKRIAEVGADSDRYTDKELKASTEYVYTVVPLRGKKEAREYGSFNALGVSAVTGGK